LTRPTHFDTPRHFASVANTNAYVVRIMFLA
jgi:hypothetical protein